MDLYRLRAVLREPSDAAEGKCLAEIPDLPGCRARGDTAAQALESLQSVTAAFITSYRDRRPASTASGSSGVDTGRAAGF